jgi:hypothetical protein
MRLPFKHDMRVLAHSLWFPPVICYIPCHEPQKICQGRIDNDQIRTTYNPPKIPKIPSIIAGQIPAGRAEGTPLPLNGTKDAVAAADPLASALSPPVRFAPLGYGEEFSKNKGGRIRPTPIGRDSSWNAQSEPVQRHFPEIGSHHGVEQFEGTRIMCHLRDERKYSSATDGGSAAGR